MLSALALISYDWHTSSSCRLGQYLTSLTQLEGHAWYKVVLQGCCWVIELVIKVHDINAELEIMHGLK